MHIPEGGGYEALNYQLTMNKHRSTDFHFSTKAPLLGICCYTQVLFFISKMAFVKTIGEIELHNQWENDG